MAKKCPNNSLGSLTLEELFLEIPALKEIAVTYNNAIDIMVDFTSDIEKILKLEHCKITINKTKEGKAKNGHN